MSKRTIATVFTVALAIGVAGVAAAPQAGELQVNERAKLRAQIVKLRVEVDLLQLEHEALRDSILTQLKAIDQAELMGQMGVQAVLEMQLAMGKNPTKELEKAMEEQDEKKREGLIEAIAKKQSTEIQEAIDRKKKAYADQATKLAERRLDLEDVEAQYRSTH